MIVLNGTRYSVDMSTNHTRVRHSVVFKNGRTPTRYELSNASVIGMRGEIDDLLESWSICRGKHLVPGWPLTIPSTYAIRDEDFNFYDPKLGKISLAVESPCIAFPTNMNETILTNWMTNMRINNDSMCSSSDNVTIVLGRPFFRAYDRVVFWPGAVTALRHDACEVGFRPQGLHSNATFDILLLFIVYTYVPLIWIFVISRGRPPLPLLLEEEEKEEEDPPEV